MMDHSNKIAQLAVSASQLDDRPADAAAALVDAAAMLCVEAQMPLEELVQRLTKSHAVMQSAFAAADTLGKYEH